jgi:hypothetical protein
MFKKLFFIIAVFALLNIAHATEINSYNEKKSSYKKNSTIELLKNFRDEEGNTLLHLALKNNDNNFAEEILAKYPNLIDTENSKHENPIHIADKHGNIDGAKLCLEYHPIKIDVNDNCYKIFKKVEGTKPYYLRKNFSEFYQPEEDQNKDKLVIIFNLPDIHANRYKNDSSRIFPIPTYNPLFQHFKYNKVPTLIIGNEMHSLSYELIISEIKRVHLPEKVIIIIDGHGGINEEDNHIISFDNTNYKTQTKDLFIALKNIFENKPIEVLIGSCYGGGAIKNVDLLPRGSTLLTLSQADKEVIVSESRAIFSEYDAKIKQENYQEYPERFSLQHFLMLYLFSLGETNNIPELAVSGGAKKFDYTQLKQYIGYKLDEQKKSKIIASLKCYCKDPNDCEDALLDVINKIEIATAIKDLMASETLYKNYWENYLLPRFLQSNIAENNSRDKCAIPPTDDPIVKKYLEKYLSLSTDFSLCEEENLPDDIKELCKLHKPVKPIFGKAMAILYIIKNENILKKDEL